MIHYIFGSDKENASPLAAPVLADDRYYAAIDVNGSTVTVERAWDEPGRITMNGDVRSWPVQPDVDEKSGTTTMTTSAWRDLLGRVMFKLPAASSMPVGNFLSFRSCFAYFARRERNEGYADWRRYFRAEKPVQIQVTLGSLFGLGRDGVLELHKVKEAEKERTSLRKLLQEGLLGSAIPTVAKLRTSHRKLRSRVDRLDQELDGFHVVDAYEDHVLMADELQREIDDLSNSNLVDQELVGDLEVAMQAEAPPEVPALERLYKEAGVAIPSVALKRYDEVAKFHEAVIRNRRAHLQSELDDTRKRIAARTARLRKASQDRNNALELISSGGALSQYRKWDAERAKARSEFEANTKQLELAEKIELMKGNLRVRRAEALNKITQEVVESRDLLEDAASLFEEISAQIYSIPATLEIKVDKDGLAFEIEHPDLGSLGVRSIQIFTFDLTVALICAKRGAWPGFLIHDSHIFDGVDGRQVARAMEIGGKRLGDIGGQYIVTMNSDDLEKAEIEGNIKFDQCIVKPQLDDSPAGCLFGIRFESPDSPDSDEANSASG